VSDLSGMPDGYTVNKIPSGLCAHFMYIGEHHYMDIDAEVAVGMYNAMWHFANDASAKYSMFKDGIYYERVDTTDYDGKFCKMDWFSHVQVKN